jgi:hypothetical protein
MILWAILKWKSWCRRSPRRPRRTRKYPTRKQNTGGKRKGKKVATTSAENDDTKSMPTEVVRSTPPNTVLVPGDGEGSRLSLATEGAGSQGQKKADRKKRKSEVAKLHPSDDGLQNVQTEVSAKRSSRR